MPGKKKVDYMDVGIHYRIRSSLGPSENARYQQHIIGDIVIEDEYGNATEKIGQILGDKLLISAADSAGCGSEPVFDNEAALYEIGNIIYDYSTNDFSEEVKEAFDHSLIERDVLVLSRIELLPAFRKAKIGKLVIKDFYNNFIGGCGLMVLKCFPIQLEYGILESESDWTRQMQYSAFEKDEEKATYSLLHFYTSMGFQYIPEVSDKLLFLCPSFVNEEFDKIELE